MTSSSSEKRCLYEVLGLKRDCTSDEIRSAYRKLALQRHPDKLIKSGVTEAEATASFQELVNAYEVLSDARERAWYDSHRSQILFSGKSNSSSRFASGIPDLFKYFTNSVYSGFSDRGKGFYKVYGDVFDNIFRNELSYVVKLGEEVDLKEAPLFGNLDSGYEQVNAFYGYWFGFATVMDFAWVDEYDVMSGGNRKSRRVMEEENKKIRKKARREFNETVRGLAEFVKKRDKRVIDMQVKRNEENERKKEEEKVRKAELAREKAERARMFEVPDWAKVEEEVEEEEVVEEEKRNELYCVACGKKFKSDKQWKNHEQSKKHKEKVAELREAFVEEEGDDNDGEVEGDGNEFVSADEAEKVKERFEGVEIREEENEDGRESEVEEEYADVDDGEKGLDGNEGEDEDDEDSVLKAMLKNRKNIGARKPKGYAKKNVYVEVEEEEVDLMEYNNTKGRGRRRGMKETAERDEDEEHKETGKQKKPDLNLSESEKTQTQRARMDPLTALREMTIQKSVDKIMKVGNEYRFSPTISFPCTIETAYRSKQGNLYTLETLVYFIQNLNIKHHDYIRNAGTHKIPAVTLLDRKPLIDYLQGRITSTDAIQFLPSDYNLNVPAPDNTNNAYAADFDTYNINNNNNNHNNDNLRDENENKHKRPLDLVKEMERPLRDRESVLECRHRDFYSVLTAASKRDEEKQKEDLQQRKDGLVAKSRIGEDVLGMEGTPRGKMMKGSKIGDGVPIILVPSASQTLITIYNVKEFMEDGVFIPTDVKMKQMQGPKPECVTVLKKFSSRDRVVTAYEVRDKPAALKAEEWGRVVAVFVLGKEWQFKDWPFKDHVEIFNKILGFYMRFEDDSVESAKIVKQWNVKIISISKNKRHQDRAAALDVWDRLEEFVRSRSRS